LTNNGDKDLILIASFKCLAYSDNYSVVIVNRMTSVNEIMVVAEVVMSRPDGQKTPEVKLWSDSNCLDRH